MCTIGESDVCHNASELEELCAFVDDTDSWIKQTITTLSWTQEHVIKTADLVECPVNPGHLLMHQSLGKHLKYCPLTSKGYSKDEIDAEQSSKFCYAHSPLVMSIDLDETALRNILKTTGAAVPCEMPATMGRALTTLSPAMRRCIYEYCVEVARSTITSAHIADEDLTLLEDTRSDKPLSKLEMLAKMRDMKRRRQSYRGKSTHTANKNYTEVIRDLLSNQMDLLANIWAEEAKQMEEKKRREAREQRDSTLDRHRRRSRSRSRKRSRDRRRSESKESRRQSRHRDDSEENRHCRSSSRKRKHSRSRSGSRSHKKHKHRRRDSQQKEYDKSADSSNVETIGD